MNSFSKLDLSSIMSAFSQTGACNPNTNTAQLLNFASAGSGSVSAPHVEYVTVMNNNPVSPTSALTSEASQTTSHSSLNVSPLSNLIPSSTQSPSHVMKLQPMSSMGPMAHMPPMESNPSCHLLSVSMCGCDIRRCAPMRRIVKLGIFHRKYGDTQLPLIANFMCQSPEMSQLNADYHHSVQGHASAMDKQRIWEMSRDYDCIFDFIRSNALDKVLACGPPSYQQLLFYSTSMDALYEQLSSTPPSIPSVQNAACSVLSPAMSAMPNVSNVNVVVAQPQHQLRCAQQQVRGHHKIALPVLPMLHKHGSLSSTSSPKSNGIKSEIRTGMHSDKHVRLFPMMSNDSSVSSTMTTTTVTSPTNPNVSMTTSVPSDALLNQRKYKCDVCSKTYKHLCNLKSHQKIHTDQALICPHCQKRFGRKANYKEHLRIHTGETPYECKFCQRKFKHHHSWKDHIRIHTGVTPYQCNICNKKFKVGHNLTVHLRIHTGEKPYQCKICLKSFRQKSAINSHLKRMHK